MLKKSLAAAAMSLMLLTGAALAATPAQAAIDSRCSITPLTPYAATGGFRYGGTINCSAAVAKEISTTGQRQSTLSWVNIETSSASSAGTTLLDDFDTASCLAGTSTYRSRTTGTSTNDGQSTVTSSGRSITC